MDLYPVDIADAIRAQIAAITGFSASAVPLSPDFEDNLPYMLVTTVGGSIQDVFDSHVVDVHCYAPTWVEATRAAMASIRKCRELEGKTLASGLDETVVYRVKCNLSYDNPDPEHPTVPRVTFELTITTRGIL